MYRPQRIARNLAYVSNCCKSEVIFFSLYGFTHILYSCLSFFFHIHICLLFEINANTAPPLFLLLFTLVQIYSWKILTAISRLKLLNISAEVFPSLISINFSPVLWKMRKCSLSKSLFRDFSKYFNEKLKIASYCNILIIAGISGTDHD